MKVAIITDTHYGCRKGSKLFQDYFESFYKNIFFVKTYFLVLFLRKVRIRKLKNSSAVVVPPLGLKIRVGEFGDQKVSWSESTALFTTTGITMQSLKLIGQL